eukprot:1344680-Pyramimonas_sp.AAC.1
MLGGRNSALKSQSCRVRAVGFHELFHALPKSAPISSSVHQAGSAENAIAQVVSAKHPHD